ncbi:MAG: hypothetical protein RL205_821 [Actinomycetota bacterium]|jgi:hypothetical protein
MPAWNAYSYAFGPVFAAALIIFFVLFLRWAFRRGSSVVAAPPKAGRTDDYGVLVPIASPGSYVEGEILRRRLEDAGIRCTLAQTLDGPRVMVWPADTERAAALLAR